MTKFMPVVVAAAMLNTTGVTTESNRESPQGVRQTVEDDLDDRTRSPDEDDPGTASQPDDFRRQPLQPRGYNQGPATGHLPPKPDEYGRLGPFPRRPNDKRPPTPARFHTTPILHHTGGQHENHNTQVPRRWDSRLIAFAMTTSRPSTPGISKPPSTSSRQTASFFLQTLRR